MEGEVGPQVSPPVFLHQGLPLGFPEVAPLARKRDSPWQRSNLYHHHDRNHQQQQQNQPRLPGSGYSSSYGNWNPKLWDWDSARFVARPASNASEGVVHLGAPSSAVAEVEQKRNGERSSKVTEDKGEDLTLKLGGGSSPDDESVARPNKRVRSGSPGSGGSYPMCQVDDCRADLSNAKDYHRRHKVCEIHSKTTKAMVGKQMQRFCQQCSRFHPLAEFDEGKRSCRRRLAGHNRRRRKTQPEDAPSRALLASNQESSGNGNLNIVNLLAILSQLQGHKVDKPSSSLLPEKDRLMQVLSKMNPLPSSDSSAKLPKAVGFDLNVSQLSPVSSEHPSKTDGNLSSQAPSTMDLLTVLSAALKGPGSSTVPAFSRGISGRSGDEKTMVHSEDPVTDMNSQTKSPAFPSDSVGKSNCAPQSSTEISEHPVLENDPSLRLQLFSSTEVDSPREMGSSSRYRTAERGNTTGDKSSSSSPVLRRLFPLQSEAETLKHNHITTSGDDYGVVEAGTSRGWASLSKDSERGVENYTIPNIPYHAGYTSSSGSDNSPSSSNSDSLERTGRIIFKLFDKDPSNLPGSLRTQILSWLSHSPSDIESYIRPGCLVLSLYLSMPSFAWDKLQEDLIQQVNLLVQHSDSDFWRTGRFLMHTERQLASHNNGKVRLCKNWRTWRAPEIFCVSPLAVVSGQETSLVLRGRNLNIPGTKIHCTYMGGYTSKELPCSSEPVTIYDSSVENFNFPGGAPNGFGRCFLEVENGFKGNSFPVIVADDTICQELRLLESEFEDDVRTSDVMQEGPVHDSMGLRSREDVLHFLNELGWLFQRKAIHSHPLLANFSNARFKFLFIFSVERDWSALIKKLLDILVEKSSRNVGMIQESLETLSEIQLLHRAVKRRCHKMIDLLLHYSGSNGLDASKVYLFPPNLVGPGGITPLHLAASMQDSEDIVDRLTDDPQEIGLNCWSSLVDDNGQSPYAYALMRNNHSYNGLVARKLANRRNGEVSITVEGEEAIPPEPGSSRELKRLNFQSLETMCSRCAIMETRRIKSNLRLQGLLQYPYLNPMLAIAAVCVCVCLFLRGAPELGRVAPFKWENLDFGPS